MFFAKSSFIIEQHQLRMTVETLKELHFTKSEMYFLHCNCSHKNYVSILYVVILKCYVHLFKHSFSSLSPFTLTVFRRLTSINRTRSLSAETPNRIKTI